MLGEGWEYVCKVLESCFMDVGLGKFILINSCGALSLNIIRMKRVDRGLIQAE